jgi:hypothetical protein
MPFIKPTGGKHAARNNHDWNFTTAGAVRSGVSDLGRPKRGRRTIWRARKPSAFCIQLPALTTEKARGAGLFQDSAGNSYGTTGYDGTPPGGSGSVVQLSPADLKTEVYSFGIKPASSPRPVWFGMRRVISTALPLRAGPSIAKRCSRWMPSAKRPFIALRTTWTAPVLSRCDQRFRRQPL